MTHDPMLDGIRRMTWNQVSYGPRAGFYVLFSDLPALLAAARADEREKALDAARDAVAALPWKVAVSFGPIDCDESCEHGPCTCSGVMRPEAWMTGPADVRAAIDALRGESDG